MPETRTEAEETFDIDYMISDNVVVVTKLQVNGRRIPIPPITLQDKYYIYQAVKRIIETETKAIRNN